MTLNSLSYKGSDLRVHELKCNKTSFLVISGILLNVKKSNYIAFLKVTDEYEYLKKKSAEDDLIFEINKNSINSSSTDK